MISEALQQLAGLFSRRFFFNGLLPTFVFTSATTVTIVLSGWSIGAAFLWWSGLDLLSQLLLLLAYFALVYFLAAAVASQWRNIVRLFEGYPIVAFADRLGVSPVGKRWHQQRMNTLQGSAAPKPIIAYYRYPTEDNSGRLLPTRLGNILLSGERYPLDRYGIDAIIFWPRLYPLLPDSFQREYEAAIIQYQFPLVVAFEATATTVICAFALLVFQAPAVVFAVVLAGGTALAYAAYLLSLTSAVEMAEQQRTAFDLYRDRLLIAWPAARDVKDTNDAFGKITDFVVTGFRADWDASRDMFVTRWRNQGPS